MALVLVHIVSSDKDEDIVDMPMKQVDDAAQEGIGNIWVAKIIWQKQINKQTNNPPTACLSVTQKDEIHLTRWNLTRI